MKIPNLHIVWVWTEGKNLALHYQPDTRSRNTPPELITRKTTVEISQNLKNFPCKRRNITTIGLQICSENRSRQHKDKPFTTFSIIPRLPR